MTVTVSVYDTAPPPSLLRGLARLVTASARRDEALGLPVTFNKADCETAFENLISSAQARNAGIAAATVAGGKVVGTAYWLRSKYTTEHVLASIDQVVVDPGFRRQGIAQRLVESLLKDGATHGIEVFELTVRANNHGAIRLYERLGFTHSGVLPGVVAIGQMRHDSVVMCREEPRPDGVRKVYGLPIGLGASI